MAPIAGGPVAIFPWGDVIEAYLDPLGLQAEDYAWRMQGGWLFGYVAGLQACGQAAVIVYASERIDEPRRLIHRQTGAPIWLVPGRRSGGGRTRGRPSLAALTLWRRTPLRAFARVVRAEGCSALLIQDYEHPRFDALVLLGRMLRLPVFASFQGGDVTLSPIEARVRASSLAACGALIVASARERERLRDDYRLPAGRLANIPNPVDLEFWRPEPRAEARRALGLAPDGLLVANHGRIDMHRKGLDVLLAAWKTVQGERSDARLVIIGSGQDHAYFSQAVQGVPGVTWISDYVTDPTHIRRWLSAADIYVTLSRTEGMPVAPLEAMACGLPVVASDAHGLPDIFQQGPLSGGLIVPREDCASAATALTTLAADEALRARLGRAGRRTVEARYSIGAVGRELAALLSAPLAADGRSPSLGGAAAPPTDEAAPLRQ